jgi:predicted permease
MNSLLRDLRYAARGLVRTPGFTVAVIAILALGIGINATMFGVVDTLFLKSPAGVQQADHVVRIFLRRTAGAMGTFTQASSSYPTFTDFRDHVPAFEQVAAMTTRDASLGRGPEARQIHASAVSHQYFALLGLRASLGRFFGAEEDRVGGTPVVVLTYGFWQRQFGGDRSILGRPLQIGSKTYTVVGVGPEGFGGIDLQAADLFMPIIVAAPDFASPEALTSRNWWWMQSIARLRPGLPLSQAVDQATSIYRANAADRSDSTAQVVLGPIQEARGPQASGESKVSAWILFVAGVVLLIACANVANLLLARGVNRRRELAVRAGLGAGRGGLMQMLLAESLLLSLLGGGAAILLAVWGGAAARGFLLPDLPADTALVDGRVLLFTLLAVLLTTVLAGVVPAVQASRADVADALKSGGHATTRGARTRAVLLAAQVAATLVLLVGAGLFVRSLRNVQALDLGFDTDKVLSVSVNLRTMGLSRADANSTYLRIMDRLAQLPFVEHSAGSMGTPFNYAYGVDLKASGVDSIPRLATGGPYFTVVTPDYFRTMGVGIERGRGLTAGDVAGAEPVSVVNATMARLLWPGKDPIGQCLTVGEEKFCRHVVGVAEDARRGSVIEGETMQYYLPLAQATDEPQINALFVRARGHADDIRDAVRREVQAAGELPYANVESLADQVAPQLRSWRLGAAAFTAFGLLALVIAATGIFAVLAYSVSQRTQEIGVRVALGAEAGQVVRMIVVQGLRAAAVGVVVGGAGAYALARGIASLLYGVQPADPVVFCVVVATLVAVAATASYLPARRAARVDPMVALRHE